MSYDQRCFEFELVRESIHWDIWGGTILIPKVKVEYVIKLKNGKAQIFLDNSSFQVTATYEEVMSMFFVPDDFKLS